MDANRKKASIPEELEALEKNIQRAEIPVSVELGEGSITIEDFLTLSKGDVIELTSKIDNPLTIKVGDIPKFTGQPGKAGKKLAVQILDSLKGGPEHDEW
nr:FliM/FliN family flagellar motor switch protein [Bacillus coahuilensis]